MAMTGMLIPRRPAKGMTSRTKATPSSGIATSVTMTCPSQYLGANTVGAHPLIAAAQLVRRRGLRGAVNHLGFERSSVALRVQSSRADDFHTVVLCINAQPPLAAGGLR